MDLVLIGLTWEICLIYWDDVIIMSRSLAEQFELLETMISRLKDANVEL